MRPLEDLEYLGIKDGKDDTTLLGDQIDHSARWHTVHVLDNYNENSSIRSKLFKFAMNIDYAYE